MLHSGHLAAKSMSGNGLAVAEAHSLGAADREILAILWLLGVPELSRPLNEMSIHFENSGWRPVIADDFTFAGVGKVTDAICTHFAEGGIPNKSVIIGHDTHFLGEHFAAECAQVVSAHGFRTLLRNELGFKFIGALINEDKIILGGEESAGLSIKGHYPEKDGIPACLLAAEAVAARGESLTQQLNAPFARVGKLESGRIGVRLTPEVMKSLKERLAQDPTEIGGRPIARTNRLDGVKFIFGDGS